MLGGCGIERTNGPFTLDDFDGEPVGACQYVKALPGCLDNLQRSEFEVHSVSITSAKHQALTPSKEFPRGPACLTSRTPCFRSPAS